MSENADSMAPRTFSVTVNLATWMTAEISLSLQNSQFAWFRQKSQENEKLLYDCFSKDFKERALIIK